MLECLFQFDLFLFLPNTTRRKNGLGEGNIMELEKEKGLFGESFLAELLEISDFIEPADEIPEGYRVIGKMNALEKAASTWIQSHEPALARLKQETEEILEKRRGKGPFIPNPSELAILEAYGLLDEKSDTLKRLLRVSVQERFNIHSYAGIALTKGFVVAVDERAFIEMPILETYSAALQCEKEEMFDGVPPPHMRH